MKVSRYREEQKLVTTDGANFPQDFNKHSRQKTRYQCDMFQRAPPSAPDTHAPPMISPFSAAAVALMAPPPTAAPLPLRDCTPFSRPTGATPLREMSPPPTAAPLPLRDYTPFSRPPGAAPLPAMSPPSSPAPVERVKLGRMGPITKPIVLSSQPYPPLSYHTQRAMQSPPAQRPRQMSDER